MKKKYIHTLAKIYYDNMLKIMCNVRISYMNNFSLAFRYKKCITMRKLERKLNYFITLILFLRPFNTENVSFLHEICLVEIQEIY